MPPIQAGFFCQNINFLLHIPFIQVVFAKTLTLYFIYRLFRLFFAKTLTFYFILATYGTSRLRLLAPAPRGHFRYYI